MSEGSRTSWMERILVVAPHADDETFSVGGTILKAKALGGEVRVFLVVAGDVEFFHRKGLVPAEARVEEFRRVMDFLGVDGFDVLFPRGDLESRLDTIAIRDIVHGIDVVMNKYRPTALLMPNRSYHQDHQVVSNACYAACRPNPAKWTPSFVFEYEYPASSWNREQYHVNAYVDVSEQMEHKLAAIDLYESQRRDRGSPFGRERVRRWAQHRGEDAGVAYAEAFEIHRYCV